MRISKAGQWFIAIASFVAVLFVAVPLAAQPIESALSIGLYHRSYRRGAESILSLVHSSCAPNGPCGTSAEPVEPGVAELPLLPRVLSFLARRKIAPPTVGLRLQFQDRGSSLSSIPDAIEQTVAFIAGLSGAGFQVDTIEFVWSDDSTHPGDEIINALGALKYLPDTATAIKPRKLRLIRR